MSPSPANRVDAVTTGRRGQDALLLVRLRGNLKSVGNEKRASLLVRIPFHWEVVMDVAHKVDGFVMARGERLVHVKGSGLWSALEQ